MPSTRLVLATVVGAVLLAGGLALAFVGDTAVSRIPEAATEALEGLAQEPEAADGPEVPRISPDDVRSLYTPAYVFANAEKRKALIETAKAANANALVIDVKDTTGVVMPEELASWVAEVREAGLLPIARVVCFQDNEWAKAHPEWALQNADGSLWVHKGLYWLDPAVPENAERVLDISLRAAALGFGEINLDYVRFPTDGNVDAISYPRYVRDTPRAPVIAKAVEAIREGLRAEYPDVTLSADLYAFSFIVPGDVGIGQHIETLGPSMDVMAPMIYPSHYSPGNFGIAKPAAHPYEVTDGTLEGGMARLATLPEGQRPFVRPWIQTFHMGAEYTPALVKASRQAVYDNTGKDSWMAWNPTATYDPRGLAAPLDPRPVQAPATTTTSTAS